MPYSSTVRARCEPTRQFATQPFVARRLGGHVVARMHIRNRGENTQHRIRIADIDDQQHRFVAGNL